MFALSNREKKGTDFDWFCANPISSKLKFWACLPHVLPGDGSPSSPWDHSRETNDRPLGIRVQVMGISPNGEFQLGVSENSVPLNPMVNDHYPY